MKVQLFYFDGCPNYSPLLERLRQILRQEGRPEHVEEINVTSPEQAQALAFLGSPTIKINGVDMEPSARASQAYAMACRTYRNAGKQEGQPDEEMIRAALREALSQPASDCCAPLATVAAKNGESKSSSLVMAGSVFAGILASLCCILPIVFGLTGLTVVGASAAFAAWRPYLLTATFGLLAAGFYFAYRPAKAECAPGSVCALPATKRSGHVVLWLTSAAVVVFTLFPYYSGAVAQAVVGTSRQSNTVGSAALATVAFRVPDMDCPACAVSLSATLRKLPGVADANLDVASRKAVVTYDPAVQNVAALEKVISAAGFHIAPAPHSL